MKLMQFSLGAIVEYSPNSMENFIKICEQVIYNITDDSTVQFYLKNAVNELVVNSLEHGYQKSSGPIFLSIERSATHIELQISDLGLGIDINRLNLNRQVKTLNDLTSRGWGLSILNKVSKNMKISPNIPSGTVISLTVPSPQLKKK